MNDPLHRLYRTKLVLLATVLLTTGLGLLVSGRWVQHASGWRWLENFPLADIGSGMFTTGLLSVAWQYLDGRDSEARASERLRRTLAETAPAMRDAVINGFAFEPEDLARVATPETLDQIITNGLAIRLGDAGFAKDVYEDVRQQAIGVPERLHDARISIHLSPLPTGSAFATDRADYFVAVVRWQAELHPRYQTRRFSCVSDMVEFREVEHDTSANSAWYVSKRSGLDPSDEATFKLLDFNVDGETRHPRRSQRKGAQTYSVDLGDEAMQSEQRVSISYTYRTVIPVSDHVLRLRTDQPTRGLSVELDYTSTDLNRVTALDFIAGAEQTTISRSSSELPEAVIRVTYSGWAFPRSGVAFVWS